MNTVPGLDHKAWPEEEKPEEGGGETKQEWNHNTSVSVAKVVYYNRHEESLNILVQDVYLQ